MTDRQLGTRRLRDVSETDGLFPLEHDGRRPFRWSGLQFMLHHASGERYLELELGRPDAHAELTVTQASGVQVFTLLEGWQRLSIDVGEAADAGIALTVSPPVEAAQDARQLGVMVGAMVWHTDAERHRRIEAVRGNFARNAAEYAAGSVVLRSTAPYLRITMEVRCNIAEKAPCVYCSWNWAKQREVGAPLCDAEFLGQLGTHLSLATEVNDCSYGEPPLNAGFADLVELLGAQDRKLLMTSNGQTLGAKIREVLLGRNIELCISLDAASAHGFARYRDTRFGLIVDNLRHLCAEKRGHDGLPHVTLSFIVMHSNKTELAEFIALARSIGVDRVNLRALYREDCMDLEETVQTRGGFTFRYADEIIHIAELVQIGARARAVAEAAEMDITVEWDNFHDNHGPAPGRPLCSEPWKTAYVLNRGIMPCCFGRKPIAQWSERGDRSIEAFVADVFNGPAFQELRRSLAAGKPAEYCLSSPSCPITRLATRDAS